MKRLLLRITDACTSRCRHCLHSCAPGRKGVMSPAAISRCIRQARPQEYVIVTGGEASLFPSLVTHALREAAELGIPSWLNTNGFWGCDATVAARYARSLKREGLAVAAFSIDGLHQEFVPIGHVLCALRACRDAGIPRVEAMVTFVDRSRTDIPVDNRTREGLAELEREPGIRVCVRDSISFIGRACASLAEYAPVLSAEAALGSTGEGYCSIQDERGATKDFCAETFFLVNPNNTVDLCNVSFPGNLTEKPFAEIVCEENLLSHPLLAAIQSEGLAGLYRMACEHGYVPRGRYTSRCDLCQSAQRWLKHTFPDVIENW
ncbi:MAG: radical SAM protein [Chthoniobacteraceae bacterium]